MPNGIQKPIPIQLQQLNCMHNAHRKQNYSLDICLNKKAQLSLTNPRDACEKFARFT